MTSNPQRLTAKQKLYFGIFDLGGNLFFTIMGFWCLKYLTDTVGIAAAWAGIAVMIGKVWDAVTDPVMGYISDRTLTRWGRRRPYLLFGAVPMMFAMWLFFSAPSITSPGQLFLWASLTLILLNSASTIINIPYSALTPELTSDYHERSSLNGYRFGCAVFGTILGAAAVQPLVELFGGFKQGAGNAQFGWSMTGLFLGVIMTIVTLITFFGVKEKPHTKADLPTKSFFASYKGIFLNRPYLILLLTYALYLTALNFLQTILAYYTEYVYGRPDITPLAMIILLLTAMVCIPLSVLVSKKIGKKRTYQICFAILATGCMIVFFLAERLGPDFFLGLMVYVGIGVGFGYVAPFAMVPDTVEYDAIKTGERREGIYYGMWTFIAKLGVSVSVFVAGIILSWGGYVANAVQSASAIFSIKLIIGPIPAVILLGAMFLIETYPLDEKRYEELVRGGTV